MGVVISKDSKSTRPSNLRNKNRKSKGLQKTQSTGQSEGIGISPVLNKKDFVRRYEAEEFGNRSPTWNTLKEFLKAKVHKEALVHIRNRIAGAPTWYNIKADEVENYVLVLTSNQTWEKEIYQETDFYYSLMAPTDRTVIQGEVQQSCQHLDLYYSTVKKPMRASLIEGGKQVYGLLAKTILDYYLDSPSLEHVNYLLNAYPNHVIEFSTYSIAWGTIPNRRTVIWEVRAY